MKSELQSTKQYDLEDRTRAFAKDCRKFVRSLRKTVENIEDGKQLVRSSGSVAANYIEANEAISRKDFSHRIKICRKESKESNLWLDLCDVQDEELKNQQEKLKQESLELMKIFGSILQKTK